MTLAARACRGPVGYGPGGADEFQSYVQANFNMVMVSDRGHDRCNNSNSSADWRASWTFIKNQIAAANEHNMTSLVDSYRCIPWGPPSNIGGDAQGPTNTWGRPDDNHKITLPETQWLAKQLVNIPGAAGLLITDDGVDLALNEVNEIEWMRAHTPTIFPWVNQCGDGSEWLARAGTPFAVPELYSVTGGPGKNATRMAQAQLAGYAAWIGKSQRFGLTHWPLVGIGDGGDVPNLHSESLVRFQAYAAVAFGAKGIQWYCWGRALWNFTAGPTGDGGPTDIYPAVQEVNGRLTQQWSTTIIEFNEWQGVFSTGWAVPDGTRLFTHEDDSPSCTPTLVEYESRARLPRVGDIVEAMDTDLLVGVMTSSKLVAARPTGTAQGTGGSGEVLLVVVDKRVDTALVAPSARSVTLQFNRELVKEATILPLGASASQLTASFNAQNHSLTIIGITGGDAVALIVCGECEASADLELQEAAKDLHRFRYNPRRPDLTSVWTTQFQYYKSDYVSKRQTTFLLGLMDLSWQSDSTGQARHEQFRNAAVSGFNLVSVPEDDLGMALNSGLREGVAVLASGNETMISSTDDIARVQRGFGCHPNFAGFSWTAVAASGGDRAMLTAARKQVERETPHAFAIVRSSSAQAVVQASNATGLPMIALAQPPGSVAELMRGLAGLYFALAEHPEAETAFLVAIDLCTLTYGQARLHAFAALMFGASGIFFTNVSYVGAECSSVSESHLPAESDIVRGRLRFAAPINDALAQWQAMLRQSGPATSPQVKLVQLVTNVEIWLPGVEVVVPGATASFPSLVLEMSDQDLAVAVYQPLGSDGKLNVTKAPPLLYVLDMRQGNDHLEGEIRTVNLTLNSSVSAWTPMVGSIDKGFPDCRKSVLGNQPLLPLEPGQAVLLGLVMLPPAATGRKAVEMQERWATAGRHRRSTRGM